jgi:hypothetical protein
LTLIQSGDRPYGLSRRLANDAIKPMVRAVSFDDLVGAGEQ